MRVKNYSFGSRLFDYANILLMILIGIITLYPMVYVASISLSSVEFVRLNEVTFFPKGFNLDAYDQAFENKYFWIGYKNTLIYTAFGTFINLFFTCTMGFCLSRKELIGRNFVTFIVIFTMFFGGGLIPSFLLIKWLNFYNTIWAVVIPGAISTFNLIIMRTFMQGIPEEMIESVKIDGANELQIFYRIILPLSKPVIATIGLFYAVGHWNSYFGPMIYLKDRIKYPLQVILKEMIVDENIDQQILANLTDKVDNPTSEMLISASIVLSLIPILLVYPYIQRFFVQGVMIGSLKG